MFVCAAYIVAQSLSVRCLRHDLAQETPLLGEDELVLFGEIEVCHAFAVGPQPRPVAFIGRENLNEISANAMLLVPSCGIQ